MSYGFTLDEVANEDDFELNESDVSILVDSMSGQYLQGATIDYKDDLMGSSFTIINPNAQTTCGCGSSFSVQNFPALAVAKHCSNPLNKIYKDLSYGTVGIWTDYKY